MRTFLIRVRQWLAAIVAVLIIATAVIVGIGRLLIPYADELRPWLETQLSERLDQPVTIERVEARWPRLTPQITLNGLEAGPGDAPLLEVARARLELHLPDLVRPDRNPFRLVLLGLDLVLAEDETGRWGLRLEDGGELGAASGGDETLAGDLIVRDVTVRVRPYDGPRLDLVISEGDIRRSGDRTTLVARAHPAAAPEAELSLTLLGRHVDGRLRSLSGRVDMRRLRLTAPGLDRLLPEFLRLPPDRLDAGLVFGWHEAHGGSADLDFALTGSEGFNASAQLRLERTDRRIDAELVRLVSGGRTLAENVVLANEDNRWAASVSSLELADLHELAGRWLGGWRHWPDSMSGQVSDLELLYQHPGSFHRLEGAVDNLTVDLPGDRLRLDDLDLDLGVAGDRAALSLSGSPVIDWPARMRRTIPIDTISGRIIVSPGAVQLDDIVGERPEAEGRANGWVWLGGERPFLDFTVISDRVGAVDPRPWLPAGKIPPKALAWLDHALLGVSGASGGINYHFRAGRKLPTWDAGDFQAWIDFRGAELDFWEGWPLARDLRGRVDFVGRSMVARVDGGRFGDVPVSAERIAIDDLTEPEIDISLAADRVSAGPLRDLVASFPIEGWSRFVDPIAASGTLSVQTDLFLPVRRMSEWQMDGRVALAGTTLALPDVNLRCPELRGGVSFDRSGIEPAQLQMAGAEGGRLEIEAGFSSPARLGVNGNLPLSRMLPDRPPFSALADRITGASQWQLRLGAHPAGGWQLEAESDLRGLSLDFPHPLSKSAEESMALDLSVLGQDGALTVSGRLGDWLDLTAEDVGGRWRLAAGLDQAAPELPSAGGFEVSGSIGRLDLKDWSDWFSSLSMSPTGSDSTGAGLIQLQLGRLDYGDMSLRDVALDAQRSQAQWQLGLSGESIEGVISVPLPIDSGRVVAIDLQRLDLARSLTERPVDDLAQAPVPAQTHVRVPTDFPPIHLLIENLHFGDFPLGRVRIESHARRDGIEIEQVEVAGPQLELSGYGRWILEDAGPVTEFQGRMISTDLPALLESFGHESQFMVDRAQMDIEGRWSGAPVDFALARLSGNLHLVMSDGRIPEAQPGAGRLVGLISFSAMPRRLMLDFRDVFGEGLKFDRIEGGFEIDDGVARTEGLRLESPAADITVSGETDLGGRTYDQTVLVEPGVSGTLPVLGGLAGGPAGAAAGLILRSLLERPLQGIGEARYRVTGPWEDPNVELIDARAAEPDYIRDEDEGNQGRSPD